MPDSSAPPPLAERLNLETIRRAAKALAGRVHRTPLLASETLSRMTGFRILLKAENLQKTGTFKPRGALYRITTLTEEEKRRGVLTASAGNHAQGLAWAAAACGTRVLVVMPENAPEAKLAAAQSYGAEVISHGGIFDDALARSLQIRDETGMTFVHPANDPDVLSGAGTIGLEILEDAPETEAILAPIGGGGLLSGIATAVKALKPSVRLFGVNPAGAPAMARAFRENRPVVLDRAFSIADGMAGRASVTETLPILRAMLDDIFEVREETILRALLLLLTRAKLLAEGAGAGPLAALLDHALPLPRGSTVVLVISGGNLDLSRLATWIREGVR